MIGYIAEDDDEAASRFSNSLLDHIELLTRFPRMGGLIPKRTRVRKLIHSPYLIYYEVDEERRMIKILHIRHGSRKPPRHELL